MSNERRVKLLWNCALALSAETHTKKLLKSHLINNCRTLAGTNASIPLERFTESQMCKRCSTHWQDNEFRIKLKPQGLQITKNKERQLIDKLKAQKNGDQRLLTKKQKTRAKWLLKKAESKLEIHCEFCQHKTSIPLDKSCKRKAAEKAKQVEKLEIAQPEQNIKKKKKTKNKDKTAGLKIPNEKLEVKKTLQPKPTTEDRVLPKPTTTKQLPTSQTLKTTQKAKLPKNTKNKNGKSKSTPKVQSKTQKQNSLLQLAALLKTQDNTKPSSNKNRLQSLLK